MIRFAVYRAGGFLLFLMGRIQLGNSVPPIQLHPTCLSNQLSF